ncbi:hypothetical protein Pint_05683 [Pistacia integerrima]|uniref:Uncharacterized protein n=1 Tax=Pistacia integerrima TaxID=434235 RepID=A0ACC0Z0K0_9ROSI|nr:hypothetical protein Pint_05683 [Pistacia integerrima]
MPLTRSEKSTAMVRPEIAETTFEFIRGGAGGVWERLEGEEAAVQKRKAGTWSYAMEKRRSKDERSRKVEVVVAAAVTVVLGIGNRVLYNLALVPLKHYPFFLAQLTTFEQISWREHLRRKKVSLNPAKVILDLMDGLEKVWDVKPLVNGKEIMSVLQLKSGWPLIREWQKKLMAACPSLCDSRGMPWLDEANLLKILSVLFRNKGITMFELLVDMIHLLVGRFPPFDSGGEKNIHPTLVRDDFTQAMHDFLPVAMRDISKPSPEDGRSGWDDVGGLNDIRNAIKEETLHIHKEDNVACDFSNDQMESASLSNSAQIPDTNCATKTKRDSIELNVKLVKTVELFRLDSNYSRAVRRTGDVIRAGDRAVLIFPLKSEINLHPAFIQLLPISDQLQLLPSTIVFPSSLPCCHKSCRFAASISVELQINAGWFKELIVGWFDELIVAELQICWS